MTERSTADARNAVSVRALDVTLDGAHVLRGVDLDASAGEWVNVIGPNGAGKTTLLRAMLGLVSFDGEIVIDGLRGRADGRLSSVESLGRRARPWAVSPRFGRPASEADRSARRDAAPRGGRRALAWSGGNLRRAARARKVAYVPQTPVIPPGMLVADYVLLGRTPHRGVFAAETANDCRIVSEVLARLDLGGFGERTVQSLSGGERQRAVMARALAQQAEVLLLDEPTTALDLGHQQDVLELVDALRRERSLTVIATLHDLTLAARYGDRIAILAGGRVAETGLPAEVLTVQNIAEHFGAAVRIVDDPEGPVIVPTTNGGGSPRVERTGRRQSTGASEAAGSVAAVRAARERSEQPRD